MKQRWRALSLGGKLAWLIIAVWMVLAAISYLPGITAYQYDKVLGGSSSLLPPMSVGPAGTHWLGTDSIGRDVAAGMIPLLIGGMYGLRKLPLRKYILPFDSLWQRVFEVKESLPSLFLLLAVTAIVAQPSIWTLAMTLVLRDLGQATG